MPRKILLYEDGRPLDPELRAFLTDRFEFLSETEAERCKEPYAVVSLGALTGLAEYLKEKRKQIGEIIVLGGTYTKGDAGAYTEHHFLEDPEAAETVLNAGYPLTLITLDTRLDAFLQEGDLPVSAASYGRHYTAPDPIRKKIPTSGLVRLSDPYGKPYRSEGKGGYVFDELLPFLYLIDRELFETREEYVAVETEGRQRGLSVIDFRKHLGKTPNAKVSLRLDRERFIGTIKNGI